MNCEEIDSLLLDFVEGEVADDQAGAIRTHLRDCPGCAAKARETRNLLGDFGVAASIERRAWSSQDGTLPATPLRPMGRPARLGDFEILDELGRGGMGIVYRARQVTLNRIVALKVLQAGTVMNERAIARFQKEAQAAARLHHTNIVPVYAQGEQDAFFYYAMELIEGQALDRVLNQSPQLVTLTDLPLDARTAASAATATHPLGTPAPTIAADALTTEFMTKPGSAPTGTGTSDRHSMHSMRSVPAQAAVRSTAGDGATVHLTRRHTEYKRIARLVAEVADALHHAHVQGIVHRDIKPQNLLLGKDDKLHITDFGLARLLDEPHLTLSAEIVGTPAYMSPEQIRGVREEIGQHTDIYSLGVTLYQMLTLRTPFTGDNYDQIITRILKAEPKPPRRLDPHIPSDLETICLRAMEKDAKRRFKSAKEMAEDLRRYAGDFPIVSRKIGPIGRFVRLVKRHPARSAAVGTAVLAAILAPLLFFALKSGANNDVTRRWNQLLENYRDGTAVLDDIGWLTRKLGSPRDLKLLEAFANVTTNPPRSKELVEELARRFPEDREIGYMLAWMYSSDGPWERLEATIANYDARGDERSATEDFFRGLALQWFDPIAAEHSFDDAMQKRLNFTQASMHQMRALNQRMYLLRNVESLTKVQGAFDLLGTQQARQAYPRYLLSIANRLAAEWYQRNGDAEKANEHFAKSQSAALAARKAEPRSARSYICEIECLDARGERQAALDVIDALKKADIKWKPRDEHECAKWEAALGFLLGDPERAFQATERAFAKTDPIDSWTLQALIARSRGHEAVARQCLERALAYRRDAAKSNKQLPSARLRLDLLVMYRALNIEPPSELFDDVDYQTALVARWTPEWIRLLTDSATGVVPWNDAAIEAAARVEAGKAGEDRDAQRLRYTLLISGERYYRGMLLLAEGRRAEALAKFADWWRYPDGEHYCWRSKLMHLKMTAEPTWPTWISGSDSQTAPTTSE